VISMAIYARRPGHGSRYHPGDIVKTNRRAEGTLARYGTQEKVLLPKGMVGSIMEVAPFRYSEGYPPTWIYRVKFPGDEKYWLRANMLVLVERNPKIMKPVIKKQAKRRRR
jgi:hypothetical protein